MFIKFNIFTLEKRYNYMKYTYLIIKSNEN